jgi:hypothetical protein
MPVKGLGVTLIYRAPLRLVSVRVPFTVLVLSGACSVNAAWRLSRGAMTTPYYQKQILDCAEEWERDVVRLIGNIWNAVRAAFAQWRRT